ncbi:MAG: SdrD B-like domain-containing protein, partial [Planctomycetota bacterium]
TIATTTTDARGNYVFKGLDLGSYKVVVTPPGGGDAATSRTVSITRGIEIRDTNVGLAPRATTPPSRPAVPPAGAPTRPAGPPRAAVFAALGSGSLNAGLRP